MQSASRDRTRMFEGEEVRPPPARENSPTRRPVARDVRHANDAMSGEHRRATRCIGSARVIERNRPSGHHAREGPARNAEVKGLPAAFQAALRAALAAGR